MSGWIKLQRQILDHWIAQDNEYLAVWVRMMAEANFEDRTKLINGRMVQVKRGQLIFGLDSYSAKTGVTISRLRTLLNMLESDMMISRQRFNKYSIISIANYDKHQDDNRQDTGKSQADSNQIAGKSQANRNTIISKELNNGKNKRRSAKSADFEPSAKLTYSQKCFDIFWQEVERRKTGKSDAMKAFEKYTVGKTEDEIDFVLTVICHWYELYIAEDESRLLPENKKYIKSASAWLNSAPWRVDQAAYAEFKKSYYGDSNESTV